MVCAMPFDFRAVRGAAPDEQGTGRHDSRPVAIWLFAVAGMIAVMVVLGGATRLTGSGLSIMEWAPLSGALPPTSEAEWRRLFDLYQAIPQYALINQGFGLEGFKHIFWLEWVHRLWGRLIGLAFLMPLLWFWATGRIERRHRPRLVLLFALGALQGAVGWFMVASGFFPDTTSVSPYRLVVHLALALLLYAATLWTGLSVLRPMRPPMPRTSKSLRGLVWICCALVALTIIAGGFVAGTHAGLVFNTFPLMDGRLVPAGYARLSPLPRNLTENIAAVQFDHRLLATLTAAAVIVTLAAGLAARPPCPVSRGLIALAAALMAQYALGVATLLAGVAVPLAIAHQAGAILLLTAALVLSHALHVIPPAAPPRRAPG
jgi:cytochrome c oxidase assembly protein subunit 15